MLAKPLLYFSVLVVLSFLFTTREMLKLQDYYHSETFGDLAEKLQHEAQMFRAQRNFYLTGFCLVLLIVIGRIYKLLKQVNKLEATSEALRKQAEGAAAAYKAMSAEVDEAKLSAKAAKAAGTPKVCPAPEPGPEPEPEPDPEPGPTLTLTRTPNPDPNLNPKTKPKPKPKP